MKKSHVFISVMFLIATALGIFGQDIAYFLHNHFPGTLPVHYLTFLTIFSIILYLFSLLFIITLIIKNKIDKEKAYLYLFMMMVSMLLTSTWSLFVLSMWWG